MPHKHNDNHRHKFERARYKVTNWPEYNDALRQRGSLTVWIEDDAIEHWRAAKRKTPGGQPLYSDMAIEMGLTLRVVFKLKFRQLEGFLCSLRDLMGLDIDIPDFSTFSRRSANLSVSNRTTCNSSDPVHLVVDSTGLKVYGEGEWEDKKHRKTRKGKTWRKLHLGLDLKNSQIICMELTPEEVGDTTALANLLNQIKPQISSFMGDGAYDGKPTYQLLENRSQGHVIEIVIPPPKNAVVSGHTEPTTRDQHIVRIEQEGRIGWQNSTGYNFRSRVETLMGRWKAVIGNKLMARSFLNQVTEATIGQKVLNKMTELGMPTFERVS